MWNPSIRNFSLSFATGKTFLGYGGREEDLCNGPFRFDKIDNSKIINIENFNFKKCDKNIYDCVILELPYAVLDRDESKLNIISYFINPKLSIISYFIDHLNENGVLFVWLTSQELKKLEKKGLTPSGLIEGGPFSIKSLPKVKPIISMFTKDNRNDLFVASFDRDGVWNFNTVKNNFLNHNSGKDLKEGFFIERHKFRSIISLKVNEDIKNMNSEYKDFDTKILKDIGDITEVDPFNDEKNCIYIPKLGTMDVVSSITKMTKKPQNYFKIKLKTDEVTSEYLVNYFKSDIAQLSLEGCFSGEFIYKISKSNLEVLEIPIIGKLMQEKMNQAYNKLEYMKNTITEIEKKLSKNPNNIDSILSDLDEKKLNLISESDKILELISHGENLHIEFKQTFFMDVKKKCEEEYIKKEALKNIAGFMNKDGGTLLIGVTDDGKIYGIENDSYQSDDHYKKRIKDIIKTAFNPTILNLIKYEIYEVKGKKVLRIDCPAYYGESFIYLKGEADGAYVRTNPACEKITGQNLIDYAIKRKKQDTETQDI